MIRIRRRTVILALALAVAAAAAPTVRATQTGPSPVPPVVPMPAQWLQGFAKAVSGDTIVYPWAYPGQTKTLLSRATDGRMSVAWLGEPVPPGAADDRITYLWHAGTASGSGAHAFTFAVNGTAVATFRSGKTADDRAWTIAGEGGATLSFRTTRIGTFNELFGFMWVTAPRSLFGTGAPRFSVTGEAAGSQDYYLGPQEPVQTFVRARSEEAVFASGDRAIRVEISTARDPEAVRIEVSRGAAVVFRDAARVHEPAACRRSQHRRAAGRDDRGGQRCPGLTDACAEDRPGTLAPPAPPLARRHRLLRSAARGRTQAVEEPA